MRNIYKIGKELFITSNEKIKVGDYITDGYNVWKWQDESSLLGRKKIILTDNEDLIKDSVQAIDNEFLEWFEKNPKCKIVNIQKDYFYSNKSFTKGKDATAYEYKIIIPKE